MVWRWHSPGALLAAATWLWLFAAQAPLMGGEAEPGRIRIDYVAPKDPKHQSLYDLLKAREALEQLQRLFSPLRLPTDLTIQTAGCDGIANAWYERGRVTLCYELLAVIQQPMPKDTTWAGTAQADTILGQFLYIAAHEVGHAVFDLLEVPIFGSEEDAADQFATYTMLRLGKSEARRLIFGAAYYYKKHLQNPIVTMKLKAFSDAHSRPPQRFFNLLCLSYGANTEIFAEVVAKGYLPKERAGSCRREYRRVERAFQRLILPHVDPVLAKEVFDEAWLKLAPP